MGQAITALADDDAVAGAEVVGLDVPMAPIPGLTAEPDPAPDPEPDPADGAERGLGPWPDHPGAGR